MDILRVEFGMMVYQIRCEVREAGELMTLMTARNAAIKEAAIDSLRIDSPPTLRTIALGRVRAAIVAGTFEPGTRLVERTLGDQLGVSRSVIREVIRHLETEGLVEMVRAGPIVARLNWNDARQIYDIRALLEPAAAADCARLADASTKGQLRKVLTELDRRAAQGDSLAMLDSTIRFYELIFLTSGHHVAWEIVARLNSRISRLRAMTLGTANRTVSGPARLREIFNAINANDARSAAKACRQHVIEARRIAQQILVPPVP
jgi:GntR family transcriptional regulator, trigonelline degradation regulator